MENSGYETRGKKRPKNSQFESISPVNSQPIIYFELFQFPEKFFIFWKLTKINQKQYHLKTPPKKTKRNPY